MSAIIMTNGRFANERIKNYEEVPEAIEQSGGIFRSSYLKNKKTLWSAPHAQTQQQDSALNYDTESDNKVLSNSAGGDCSKGLYGSLHDVFISDKERNDNEMKIACSEATDSSIDRSANGVGGQTRRQAGNCKCSLIHNAGNVKDEINKAALRWTVNDDGTLTPENKPSTGNLESNITEEAPKVKSVFEIAAGSVFDRARR